MSSEAVGGFNFAAENQVGYPGMKGSGLDMDGQFNSLIGGGIGSEDTGFKCPVYKCTKKLENDQQLD